MPRKQRFKPSRKPKPTITEETPKPMGDQQARSPISESEGKQERMDDRGLDRVDGSTEDRPSE
jgi:hypothetical protein